MRYQRLSAEDILKLVYPDLPWGTISGTCEGILKWVATNLVLPTTDCPHCGQDASDCDEAPCDGYLNETEPTPVAEVLKEVQRVLDQDPREKCMDQYRERCQSKQHPDFLYKPICDCGHDFTDGGTKVPSEYTTGCPRCHRTFCD